MRKETYDILSAELMAHNYGIGGKYNIEKLLHIFVENEISQFKDLFNSNLAQDFKNFIMQNLNNLRGLERDNNGEIKELEILTARAITHKISYPLDILKTNFFKNRQERYVKDVINIVGNTNDVQLMDVGSGEIPYSSLLLAQHYNTQANDNKILTMEKKSFILPDETIQKLGCTPLHEEFGDNTDTRGAKLLTGRRPCSAIPHMVSIGVQTQTPYFIELCPCDSPDGTIEGWQDYLRLIDQKIKFTNNYAHNLDM